MLSQAVLRSPIGGNYLSSQCRKYLESQGIDLTPGYMVATKESVREREPPRFTVKKMPDHLTNSWQQYMLTHLMQDFQISTSQVLEVPYDERTASQIPSVHYEFPSGYHQDFGCERFKLAESLFDHSMLGAGQLASTSIGMCDTDVRMSLYGSVVITGGNSLLQVCSCCFLLIETSMNLFQFDFSFLFLPLPYRVFQNVYHVIYHCQYGHHHKCD